MALREISKGTVPNDGTGTQAPEAADIINGNFAAQQASIGALARRIGDVNAAIPPLASVPAAIDGVINDEAVSPAGVKAHFDARGADQDTAEEGDNNDQWMSSLRTRQQIDARIATDAEAEAGTPGALMDAEQTRKGQRIKLKSDKIISVGDGGDFANIAFALKHVGQNIDLADYDVYINVADGIYLAPLALKGAFVGRGNVILTGNTVTPSNCVIQASNANALTLTNKAKLIIQGFQVKTTGSAGDCFNADEESCLLYGDIDFSDCAETHITLNGGAKAQAIANHSISGNPGGAHVHIPSGGKYLPGAHTVTLIGTRAWGAYFIGMRGGDSYADLRNVTFAGSGAINGRCVVHMGAVLDMENRDIDLIPGSIPMVQQRGGIIICAPPQFAVGQSRQISGITDGLLHVIDGVGRSALLSYRSPGGNAVDIVWQNDSVALPFSLVDPGPGSDKWWVQPSCVFTNRYVAPVDLTVTQLTPSFDS